MESMKRTVVTVGHKAKPEHFALARDMAEKLRVPFVERGNTSLDAIREKFDVPCVMVVKDRLVVDTPDGELYFHPGVHWTVKRIQFIRYETDCDRNVFCSG